MFAQNIDLLHNLTEKENFSSFEQNAKINPREELIASYGEIIPDIREYCEFKSKGNVDFKFMNKEIKESLMSNRIRTLFFSIVDIRNNNSPTSTESNAIIKTDNKFSNEIKKHVRTIVSKGLTSNEVGYEMIYLYGYSALCSSTYQENVPIKDTVKNSFCLLTEACFVFLSAKFTIKKLLYLMRKRV